MTVSHSNVSVSPGTTTGRRRPEASGGPELHLLADERLHAALVVRDDLGGAPEPVERDALFLGVAELLDAGGSLGLRAPVDAADRPRRRGARETRRQSIAVLPAPMTTMLLPERDGRVLVGEVVAAHEVHARQELVRAVDLAGELAGDAEERGRARARSDEDGVEPLLREELRDRERLADDLVRLEADAHVLELLHLAVDDVARQPEGRDPVAQDAADDVQRLEDRHVRAVAREVARAREAGRAGAHDRDPADALRRGAPAGRWRARGRPRSARGGRSRPTPSSSSS